MFKAVLYTDPHVCKYASIVRKRGEKYSVRLHNLIKSISWVEHLAEEEDCDEVIVGGDYFDTPDLDAEVITAVQDMYFANMPHIMITGNHDSNIASLEYSSINIFKSIKADIITQPKCVEVNGVELYFIPYIADHKLLSIRDYLHDNNKKKIVITHNDLAGIRYGRFTSESGFDVTEVLNNCTLFLDGHLHNGYVINDRIVLIGNLTGQNFNEDATIYDHYAYILTIDDDGTISLEPRVNPYALNFYKLFISKPEEISRLDNLKNNAVLSVSCTNNLLEEVKAKLVSLPNLIEYKLLVSYTNNYSDEESIEFNVDDHIKQFIDYVQTKIEPSSILTEELALLGSN